MPDTSPPDPAAPALSIVIPAFNEDRRIGDTLLALRAWLDQTALDAEVLVVDDGSSDATAAVVADHQSADPRIRLVRSPRNRGKGHAVGLGVADARGDLVMFTDADLSIPIAQFFAFRDALERDAADLAIATRAHAAATVDAQPPLHRRLMGRVFNAWVRAMLVPGLRDTQCGFKVFRAAAARSLFAARTIDDYTFDVEILFLAQRRGFRVVEVPVHWSHHANSRVLPVRDSLAMFFSVLRLRRTHR